MNGFVQAFRDRGRPFPAYPFSATGSRRKGFAKARRRQHAYRTRQDRGFVGEDIAEEVGCPR